jgi:cyclopropane-fatty-acyl-phospholipid synthase
MLFDKKLAAMAEEMRSQRNVPMQIELWDGRRYALGDAPKVRLKVPKAAALRYLINPDMMKLGEAFVEGHVEVEGQLKDIFEVAERFASGSPPPKPRLLGMKRLGVHSRKRDKRAIEYHYDVSNDFYRLFLDERMVYSCAYFRTDGDSLALAQEQKLDHILTKLMVKPGERFLDIGCGWGAMVVRAAKKFGARATGVTLSERQFEYCQELIRREGLEGQVEVRIQDYRDIPGEGVYDKISSVGMFEHVGHKNLLTYFSKIHSLLAPGGLAMNHGITSVSPDSADVGMGAGDFIDRYVFPDGELPHISLALREIEAAGLEPADVESLRRHYARTCAMWADRLEASRDRALELIDPRRYRIWSIYLAGCAHAFAHGWINIYQILCAKKNDEGTSQVPMTRDYMYAARG